MTWAPAAARATCAALRGPRRSAPSTTPGDAVAREGRRRMRPGGEVGGGIALNHGRALGERAPGEAAASGLACEASMPITTSATAGARVRLRAIASSMRLADLDAVAHASARAAVQLDAGELHALTALADGDASDDPWTVSQPRLTTIAAATFGLQAICSKAARVCSPSSPTWLQPCWWVIETAPSASAMSAATRVAHTTEGSTSRCRRHPGALTVPRLREGAR